MKISTAVLARALILAGFGSKIWQHVLHGFEHVLHGWFNAAWELVLVAGLGHPCVEKALFPTPGTVPPLQRQQLPQPPSTAQTIEPKRLPCTGQHWKAVLAVFVVVVVVLVVVVVVVVGVVVVVVVVEVVLAAAAGFDGVLLFLLLCLPLLLWLMSPL
eukprot:Skav214146  [mRNA]  locus=scaffold1645:205068:205541:- [translate_table: standard]